MPPRRTLRNPDPYLLDYLTDEFIAAIVQAAYATNDLGTYMQAKELAALVAE